MCKKYSKDESILEDSTKTYKVKVRKRYCKTMIE